MLTLLLNGQVGPDYAAMSNSSLRNGDFYVTKHSNLCEIHVLFHMVADDSVMSGQINSRHPVVMGLRHVQQIIDFGKSRRSFVLSLIYIFTMKT